MGAEDGSPVERLRRLVWGLDAEELAGTGSKLLDGCTERLNRVVAGTGTPTVAGYLTELDRVLLEVRDVGSHGNFVFNVHPDAAVRDAGRGLSEAADRFFNAFRLNVPAYELLGRLEPAGDDRVTRDTVDKMRREMRRAGVEKDGPTRARLQALSDAIDSVGNQFAQNIATRDRTIELEGPDRLDGLPDDYRRAHPPGPDGRIRVTTRYPDYNPVLAYADRAEVRRTLMHEFMNRAYPENLPVLDELLAKRHEFASILGYPAFSALALEDKMMQTRENARTFLREAAELLRAGTRADYARLLARKRKEDPGATALHPWDETYYRNRIRNEEYGVDARALRAYLPYGPVRDGLFRLCAELFELEFRPVGAGSAWHPTVETYEVLRRGEPMGRIHLDMVPREGKFSHAACFGIRTGLAGVQLPEAALVCNFVDPNGPKERARMEYRDVITFFHEFGHLLHAMFSGRVPWTYAHQLEWDFVEAPSLLFEEWARDPATLARFARDPDTGATIPAELLQRLEAAEAFGRPAFWMRQVALAAISFVLYDGDPTGVDTSATYRRIWDEHLPTPLPDAYHPQAAWGHLTGYSACYYTYAWSLVIARDLLSPFRERGNLTDAALARRYAAEILAPGGSRPAAESVRSFLGRPFDFRAFEAWIREADAPAR